MRICYRSTTNLLGKLSTYSAGRATCTLHNLYQREWCPIYYSVPLFQPLPPPPFPSLLPPLPFPSLPGLSFPSLPPSPPPPFPFPPMTCLGLVLSPVLLDPLPHPLPTTTHRNDLRTTAPGHLPKTTTTHPCQHIGAGIRTVFFCLQFAYAFYRSAQVSFVGAFPHSTVHATVSIVL